MNIVIAGGGTGGHLFPGIAIAREFLRVNSENRILFIGTKRGIESRVIPGEGFRIKYVTASGFKNRPLLKKMVSFLQIPISVFQALAFLAGFRADIVVGVGGYASGAVGLSSFLLNVPLVIQEQNLKPGVTNRILGRISREIFTSFAGTGEYLKGKKVLFTGNPVRAEINARGLVRKENREEFSILVLGGSLGAASINRAVTGVFQHLSGFEDKLSLVVQTGESGFEPVKEVALRSGFNVEVYPFIKDMGMAYENADLVISRSGATTLSEITAAGKPAILIPFPFAVENHQELNGRELEKRGGGRVILDSDFSGERLAGEITHFFKNRDELSVMEAKSKEAGRPGAATSIVKRCFEITGMVCV